MRAKAKHTHTKTTFHFILLVQLIAEKAIRMIDISISRWHPQMRPVRLHLYPHPHGEGVRSGRRGEYTKAVYSRTLYSDDV